MADDHMPISYGMEGYQCNYKEGVTLNDLVEFTNEDLNPYADKSWSAPYSGFYLTPFLRSGDTFSFLNYQISKRLNKIISQIFMKFLFIIKY